MVRQRLYLEILLHQGVPLVRCLIGQAKGHRISIVFFNIRPFVVAQIFGFSTNKSNI